MDNIPTIGKLYRWIEPYESTLWKSPEYCKSIDLNSFAYLEEGKDYFDVKLNSILLVLDTLLEEKDERGNEYLWLKVMVDDRMGWICLDPYNIKEITE